MGLPAISAREELILQIPDILTQAGITVTLRPLSEEDIARRCPAMLDCSLDRSTAKLMIYQAKTPCPCEFLLLISPVKRAGPLITLILNTLKAHGAVTPQRPEREPAKIN